jgi:WD40 repeat protein/tetratricopeptide (TPR) repeat protein
VADKPVILLAFANDQEGQRYLRNLPEELRQLQEVLEAAARRGLCELVVRPNVTLNQVLDVFTTYRDRVAIFHYAGHAGPDRLLLEASGPCGAEVHAEGLAAFLGQRRGLVLVFLNGCSTRAQVARLLKANVSAVIATARDIDDLMAREFAVAFYTELASGAGLRAAYEVARARIYAAHGTQSPGIARDMTLAADSRTPVGPSDDCGFPWDMQVRPGAELVERWNLPDAAGDPLFGLPEPNVSWLPPAPFRHLQRFTRDEAVLFFGRGGAIRDLYGLVVAPGTAPLVLYHGQTGVGKSSLLDAGLLPRLESRCDVLYLRRDQALGLLGTACQGLGAPADTAAAPADLGRLWLERERSHVHRPLILILDQAEEAYTRPLLLAPTAAPTPRAADPPAPSADGQAEVAALIEALRLTFAHPAQRPHGRVILSFRTEWLAAFEHACQEAHLWFVSVALGPLDGPGIAEAVEGPSRVPLLQVQYRLSVEPGLSRIIADNLLADAGSAVAPTLQVLLAQMWEQAHSVDPSAPRFDRARYEILRKQGLLLGDFLDQQLAAVEREHGELVQSGLVLDVLEYHTTPLGTAEQRHREDLEARYTRQRDAVGELLASCTSRYLLVEGRGPTSPTRLAHDTLGPLVQERFKTSLAPGQRARRILENRATDWKDGQTGPVLDGADLATVEQGLPGMRAPTGDELRLLNASRVADQQRLAEEAEHQRRLREAVEHRKQAEIQARAETERRLEEQRAANRKLRRRAYTLGTILVASFILAAVAAYESREAHTQARLALSRQREAERHAALSALDQGLGLCVQGDSHRGMLWLAHAFRIVPVEAKELRDYLRLNLHAWGRPFHHLVRSIEHRPAVPGRTRPPLAALAFSPDGTLLATASGATARLWNTATAQPIGPPLTHGGFVWAVAFSPNGTHLATASDDGKARIWNLATAQLIGEPTQQNVSVQAVAFSPDGKHLAAAGGDGTIRLWDTATQASVGPPMKHPGPVRALAFSPDGTRLATAGGTIVQFWDAMTARPANALPAHAAMIAALAFSPDGTRLATASEDATAQLWDAATARRIGQPLRHRGWVKAVAFSPDGMRLATASEDSAARLWDAITLEPVGCPLQHHSVRVNAVAFSPDGKLLATGDDDGTARLWDVATPRPISSSLLHPDRVRAVAFSPDGKLLATAGDDKMARLWDVATARPFGSPLVHQDKVHAVAFSPDGRLLATAGDDKMARLWDTTTARPFGSPLMHEDKIHALAFSHDGERLVTGGDDEMAQLWSVATRKGSGPPMNHKDRGMVRTVAFNRDGKLLATASGKTAWLWDTETARSIGALEHHDLVHGVAFSPDGRLLVTASGDKTARLWNVATQRQIGPPLLHGSWLSAVAFSPDGTLLATASDTSACLWDLATARQIGPPLQHRDWVSAVAFSPDGKLLATASGSTAWLWDVPTPVVNDPDRIVLWSQVITAMELNDNHVVQPLRGLDWEQRRDRLEKRGGLPSQFRRSLVSDRNWHDREATHGGQAGGWFAAHWHIDRMIAASPQDASASLYGRRGLARARLGRWAAADADLEKAAARTDDLECWYAYALLRLHLGKTAGYRTICERVLKRLGEVDDAGKASWLSLICTVAPDAGADAALPVHLAESLVMRNPNDPCFLAVLGAALFRAGQLDEAVARLDAVVGIPDNLAAAEAVRARFGRMTEADLQRQGFKPTISPECATSSRLFLAMAHQRLGHTEKAKSLIEQAIQRIREESLLDPNNGGDTHFTWSEGLRLWLLRREAERFVKRGYTPAPADNRLLDELAPTGPSS